MSAVTRSEQILLVGPPYKLTAVTHLDAGAEKVFPVRLQLAGEWSLHRAYIRALGDASEVRLKLPHDTPPGTYRGEATLGGVPHAIAVQVTPALKIRVNPSQTLVAVEPGGSAEFAILVSNSGNVAVDLPKSSALDLDDEEGQDRALGRTLRAELDKGESRVERFFEELRVSHGGEARVIVTDGAGDLAPGESRSVRCQLEVPVTAQPGRSYLGGWEIGSASHLLLVEITKSGPRVNVRKSQ
jgi:hypothetical protein